MELNIELSLEISVQNLFLPNIKFIHKFLSGSMYQTDGIYLHDNFIICSFDSGFAKHGLFLLRFIQPSMFLHAVKCRVVR